MSEKETIAPVRIAIVMYGGTVTDVVSDASVEYVVHDTDIEDELENCIAKRPSPYGGELEDVYKTEVRSADVDAEAIERLFKALVLENVSKGEQAVETGNAGCPGQPPHPKG